MVFLFTSLYRQKTEESKKMKKKLREEFECNFVESDDNDDEENISNDEDEYSPSNLMN